MTNVRLVVPAATPMRRAWKSVIDVAVAVIAIGVAGGLWGKVQSTRPSESIDGIRAGEILSVSLTVAATEREEVARAQAALIERLRREPDVRSVTFATTLPRMDHPNRMIVVEQDAAVAAPAGPFKVRTARIATDFFGQLEQPLVAGRAFDARDLATDARSVIVNTTFAERAFGEANPIGKRLREATRDGAPAGPWLEIVGMVGHMGVHVLTPTQDDGLYFPLREGEANPVRLAIWLRGSPADFAPRLRELAEAVAPNAAVATPIPLDEMFEALTLIQTDKIHDFPVIIVGRDYWGPLLEFIQAMPATGTISPLDLELVLATDSVDEAIAWIKEKAISSFGLTAVTRRPSRWLGERPIRGS